MKWEKILANHMSDKESISKIYKKLGAKIKKIISFKNRENT